MSAAQNRGNSLGAMLLMEDATVTIGNNDLLEKVEWKIMPGERWAIVGPNGTGKSTMLKAITGQDTTVKLTTGRLVLHPTAAVRPPLYTRVCIAWTTQLHAVVGTPLPSLR